MFEKTIKKVTDRFKVQIDKFAAEKDLQLSPKLMRFIDWYLYTAMPFIFKIVTYLSSLWIFNKIHTKYGFEKVVIILLVLLLLKSENQKES
jgi:hypothetical protein